MEVLVAGYFLYMNRVIEENESTNRCLITNAITVTPDEICKKCEGILGGIVSRFKTP